MDIEKNSIALKQILKTLSTVFRNDNHLSQNNNELFTLNRYKFNSHIEPENNL